LCGGGGEALVGVACVYLLANPEHSAYRPDVPDYLRFLAGELVDQHEPLGEPGGQRAGPLWKKFFGGGITVYFEG
jgi:hypothetical protein